MFSFPWPGRTNPDFIGDETELVIAEEARLPLHILARDARLSVENAMLCVESSEDQRTVRLDEISLIALHGGAQVSVPCLHLLAKQDVPLILLSRNGYYIGQMTNLSGNHSAARRAQYTAAADPRKSLVIARGIVEAKLSATARLARRRLGARDKVTKSLNRAVRSARRARTAAGLRGVEGSGAAAWYGAWPRMLERSDDLFTFDGRSRRPARDATNALLSYLYAVTTGTAAAAAEASGLDVNVGFYHVERPGRPALALDLVEPLRPAVVDAAVLTAIRRGEFTAVSFETQDDGSVRLSQEGRRTALDILERRLSTTFIYAGTEMTWRAAITHHAGLLTKSLRGGELPVPMLLARG